MLIWELRKRTICTLSSTKPLQFVFSGPVSLSYTLLLLPAIDRGILSILIIQILQPESCMCIYTYCTLLQSPKQYEYNRHIKGTNWNPLFIFTSFLSCIRILSSATSTPNVAADWVEFYRFVLGRPRVLLSVLRRDIFISVTSFRQPIQANTGLVPQIRPRSLPSMSFSIYFSFTCPLFNAI